MARPSPFVGRRFAIVDHDDLDDSADDEVSPDEIREHDSDDLHPKATVRPGSLAAFRRYPSVG